MVSGKSTDIVKELEIFLQELKDYQYYRLLEANNEATRKQIANAANLRDKLLRDAGRFRSLIAELTGKEKVKVTRLKNGREYEYDLWFTGLQQLFNLHAAEAISYCIDVTSATIGRLEDDIKKGYRDEQGKVIEKPYRVVTEPPKAFISHGKESVALNKLEEFLRALGIEPLIVKEQPSLDKTIDDKVNYYLSQADFVVILATGDDEIEGKLHPRQNVIHEIGLAQRTHEGKIIYLLEAGTEFPSNISPKVWERFKQRNMIKAFLCIVRELRAYGILKCVKP